MKNAVIYTRSASPNKQSIDAQLEVCRAYALTHGYHVVAEYVDDGYSGMNFNRPAFVDMNDHRNQWQTVIVYRNDKLSRNCREFCKYRKTLHDEGKEIVSTAEQLPDATTLAILESLQEYYNKYQREVHKKWQTQ